MANRNEIFEQLLKEITERTGKSEKEIAIAVKRNPGYVAQLRSRIQNGEEVPQKFIDLLRLNFPVDAPAIKKRDELVLLKAQVKILMHELVELKHTVTKESATKIFLEIEKMTLQEITQQSGGA